MPQKLRRKREKKKKKPHHSTLMPPHQLYHSAHSCHLDHFLFSPKFFIIRAESCQPPERCAAVQIPSRRRFCLFLKAPQRFFFLSFLPLLKGGLVEKRGEAEIRGKNTGASWLYVCGARSSSSSSAVVSSPLRVQQPANTSFNLLLLCFAQTLRVQEEGEKKERKKKKTSIQPPGLH